MDRTLPQLGKVSEINDFGTIRRISKWSPHKMQVLCNSSTNWKSQIGFRSRGKEVTNLRQNVLEMLDFNRRDLAQKSLHEREALNLSYARMLRLNDKLSKKTGQIKVKRNKRPRKTDNFSDLLVHFVTEVKEPEKNFTSFSVAIQKLEYFSYQKFFGFRQGACLSSCDRVLYLHGGYSGQFDNNKSYLHQFDFNNKIWVEPDQKGELPSMSRIGQAVQQWRGNLFFVGGMGLNLFGKKRVYSNEMSIFNPDRGQWTRSKILQGKRYHASTRFLHFIIVYGGINEKEQYLDNISIINLQSMNSATTSFKLAEDINGIAYHKIISTMEMEAKKRGDLQKDGVYCFGGKNNNGDYIEGLRVLNLQINSNSDLIPKQWTKIKTQGTSPKPRINHTMNLLPRLSSICIIGGQSESNEVLKDIFILNLHNLNWYTPQLMFDEALMYGLSGHTSTVIGSKIYIFGGMQSDGKYSTSLLEVETDQNRIHTSAYQKLKRNGLINSIGQNGQKKL